MSEQKALVCVRRDDLRTPPVKSSLDRCSLCREPVWVAASSPKADVVFCRQCAMDMIEPGDKAEPLTERQIADVRRALLDG